MRIASPLVTAILLASIASHAQVTLEAVAATEEDCKGQSPPMKLLGSVCADSGGMLYGDKWHVEPEGATWSVEGRWNVSYESKARSRVPARAPTAVAPSRTRRT